MEVRVSYDSVDLLADMGGFLGLFLGYSIFSMIDDVKKSVVHVLKRFNIVKGSSEKVL